jgi:hypothetical protein
MRYLWKSVTVKRLSTVKQRSAFNIVFQSQEAAETSGQIAASVG